MATEIRTILQQDERDCGPACLAALSHYYGKQQPIARIRELAGTDQEGTSLLGLAEAAEAIGLQADGFKAEPEALPELPLPAIAHWDDNHFVTILAVKKDIVTIGDPAEGTKKISLAEFCRNWTGYLLVVQPGQQSTPVSSSSRLGRFVSLLRPRWKTVLEIILCSLIIAGLSLTSPVVIQFLMDHILISQNVSTLNWFMLALLGLLVFTALFVMLRRYLLAHLGRWLDITLMQGYYNHIMDLPARFFVNRKVGEVLSRFNDAAKIRQMLGGTAILSIVDLLMTIAAVLLMFVYHWKLALVTVAFLPFFAASFAALNPLLRRRSRQVMELAADAQAHIVESFGGAVGVKCSAAAKQMRWVTDRRLGRMLHRAFGLEMLDTGIETLANIVGGLGTAVVLWYGAYSVIHQQLTIGQLMAFYSLVGMVLSPVERLMGLNRELQDALVAADRLLEIMDIPTETEQEQSMLSDVDLSGDILLDSVTFHFPGRLPLFEDFSCRIPGGKTTVIIGPSGSGKSTLCQMLNRLQVPDKGRATIGRTDLSLVALPVLRRKVGYISTTPFVFSGTVRENIQLGQPEANFASVTVVAQVAQAHEFIEQLPRGYDTVLSEGGANLSTGQRLRIVLARAILANPQALVLDEVSSLLDPATESRILAGLREALPSLTLILVTHRHTARQWIDHKICLGRTASVASENENNDNSAGQLACASVG